MSTITLPTGRRSMNGPGSCLRTLRKLAGLTRRQAARRAECSHRFLRAVERGELPGTPSFYGRIAAVCAEEIRHDGLEARA